MSMWDWVFGKKKPERKPLSGFSDDAQPDPDAHNKFIALTVLAAFKKAYLHERAPSQKGLHVETLLSALGAVAGFACQITVREAFVKTGRMPEQGAFVVLGVSDGSRLFAGDLLNRYLLESPRSVWSLVGGAAQAAGAETLPDIREIARFVIGSVGNDYGSIRVPPDHQPHETPLQTLKTQWAAVYQILKANQAETENYGLYLGLAGQYLILEAKGILDPKMAAQIFMESAVSMAKIDPQLIGFTV